jgi:chromatin structure-remodeling complex subunit RSC1/2
MKRRDYKKMDAFVVDMNLMFNNAKLYNADESQIFQDAVSLQVFINIYTTHGRKLL